MTVRSSVFAQRPYLTQFVFAGVAFTSSYQATILAGNTAYIQLDVGSTNLFHFLEAAYSTNVDNITVTIYEAPTFTTGTTPIAIQNAQREFTITSESTLFDDPTGVSGGTPIDVRLMPGQPGGGPILESGEVLAQSPVEKIFKRNTTYIWEIVNGSASDAKFVWNLTFYESSN